MSVGGSSLVCAGNPNLVPAEVTNYEVDYDRSLPALGVTLRLATFYEITRDVLTSPLNAPPIPTVHGSTAYAQNVGSSDAVGGELSIKATFGAGWRWSLSDAVMVIHDHLIFPTLAGSSLLLNYERGTPHNVIDAAMGYATGPWEFDLQARWQSRFMDYIGGAYGSVNPFPIDNQLILNTRIGYKISKQLTLAFSGAQLADPRRFAAAGAPVERRVTCSITAAF